MKHTSSHQGGLPNGYDEVEWLRGSGTQYCETSYSAVFNSNFYQTIKGDIIVFNDNNNCSFAIADSWVGAENQMVGVKCDRTYFSFYYGRQNSDYQTISISQFGAYPIDIHYELNATNVKANNIVINKSLSEYASPLSDHFLIGAYKNNQGVITVANEGVYIKKFALYNEIDGLELISEFIPCYRRQDHKPGFYETGTQTFLQNLGSGYDWIIGPVV